MAESIMTYQLQTHFLKSEGLSTISHPLTDLEGAFFSNKSELNRNKYFVRLKLGIRFLQKLSVEEKRAFAVVLKIKSKYTNSRIYNFSYVKMKDEFGLSYHNAKKYVDIIQQKGWGKLEKDTLKIFSFKTINDKRRRKSTSIDITFDDVISSIVDKINLVILRWELNRQQFVVWAKEYEKKSNRACKRSDFNYNDFRKLIRIKNKLGKKIHVAYIDYLVVGYRKLAEVFNCSISYIHDFLHRMQKKGVLKIEEAVELIQTRVSSFINNENCPRTEKGEIGYFYVHRNNLYRHLGTKITYSMDF